MNKRILTGLLAGTALLGMAAAANAKVLELRVRSGGDTNITTLSFAGPSGSVADTGSVNSVNYTATGTSTEGSNNIGLDITTLGTNTTSTVRTVQYALTVTGLTGQPTIQGWQDLFDGTNPISGGSTVSNAFVRVYYDAANVKYGTSNLVYDSGFPAGCGFPPAYSCSSSGSISLPSVFSLTEILTVTYKVNSLGVPVASNNAFSAVPEPTSLALLGSGLLLAGWMFRRRRNDKTV